MIETYIISNGNKPIGEKKLLYQKNKNYLFEVTTYTIGYENRLYARLSADYQIIDASYINVDLISNETKSINISETFVLDIYYLEDLLFSFT